MTWSDGTAYYGVGTDPVKFETARRALAEGNSLRAAVRIVEVDKDQVGAWLDRGARQCRAVILHLWWDLPVMECQLDAWWSFIHTQPENLPGAKQDADTSGDAWVWWAFAPVWRWVLGFVIGKHDPASADRWLEQVVWVTDGTPPFFTRDPWPAYTQALLMTYGEWYRPPRPGARGPHPKPHRRPRPDLLYAQVIKRRTGGRITAIYTDVVLGDPAAVAARLAPSPVSQRINTSCVERDNWTQRQPNRRLTRRTHGFSQDLTGFEQQRWLSLAYYPLILPPASWRTPVPVPEPTYGTGSPRRWRPVTPAMAAGITDPVWTTRELLSYRVSPLDLQKRPIPEKLFPSWPEVHHGS